MTAVPTANVRKWRLGPASVRTVLPDLSNICRTFVEHLVRQTIFPAKTLLYVCCRYPGDDIFRRGIRFPRQIFQKVSICASIFVEHLSNIVEHCATTVALSDICGWYICQEEMLSFQNHPTTSKSVQQSPRTVQKRAARPISSRNRSGGAPGYFIV